MPACLVGDSQVDDSTFCILETAMPCLFEALCLVEKPIRAPIVGFLAVSHTYNYFLLTTSVVGYMVGFVRLFLNLPKASGIFYKLMNIFLDSCKSP